MDNRRILFAGSAFGLCLATISAHGALVVGNSVTVDFNSASDIGDFVVIRDDTPSNAGLTLSHNAGLGTGVAPSGGAEATNVGTTNGGNDFAAFYGPGGSLAAGAITVNPGETVTLTLKFFTADATRAATPRLGIASLADVNTVTSNGATTDVNNGKDLIGGGGAAANNLADGIGVNVNGSNNQPKDFSIFDVNDSADTRVLSDDPSGPYTLADSTWYQFDVDITKSLTANEFDVSAVLNQLDADGLSLVTQIGSHSTTITNASLYTDGDVIAGFTIVHNNAPATLTNEYDDLTIAVTPEPGTLALLALGGMLVARRRR